MSVLRQFAIKTFTAGVVLFWSIAPMGKAIGESSQQRPVTEAPALRDSLKRAASEKSLAEQRNFKGLKLEKRGRAPASTAPVRIQPNTGPDAGTADTSPERAAHRTSR